MHAEIRTFLQEVKSKFPDFFQNKNILEVGSLDINGSPREYFDNCNYTGVDIGSGKGVDIIKPIHEFFPVIVENDTVLYDNPALYDAVVSTEMLEHDIHWEKSLKKMVELLKPGGLFILTCAGPKRPEHGTKATDTFSSPYTTDYYRNISVEDFIQHVPRKEFSTYIISYGRGGEDLLFYGVKLKEGEVTAPVIKELTTAPCMLCPLPVTVGIPTKNRYETLRLTLLSIAMQNRVPNELIIVDDSDEPLDIRTDQDTFYILKMLNARGVDWKVRFGEKKGQHLSHQLIQRIAKNELIFRIDDDEIAEANVINHLYELMTEGVGAVGCSVLMPDPAPLPAGVENKISLDMSSPNVQWFVFRGIKEAEHLYSCFMYRRGIAEYETELSTVSHREETLFSYSIFKKGYKLLITGDVKVWHFRADKGGIRTFNNPALWEHDEQIFRSRLIEMGDSDNGKKIIVLDNGLGDHFAFKTILPKLRMRYPELVLATCFPDAFWDYPDIKQISIAEAKLLFGNIDRFNIYKFMIDKRWKGTLVDAFIELYLK